MKRLVLFGVAIFLVIIGGFLVVDKVWLHKVFKIKPGSCLILEEKYCKTGEIKYEDNKPIGIVYKIENKTPLFSPISEKYILQDITMSDSSVKNYITIGGDINGENINITESGYNIFFDGEYISGFTANSNKKIKQGNIFGYTSTNKVQEVVLIPFLEKIIKTDFGNTVNFTRNTNTDEEKITTLFSKTNKK